MDPLEDHDYSAPFKYERPLLSLTQLALLAVLNSESRSLSPESIAMFIFKHFPYYQDFSITYITKFIINQGHNVLQKKKFEGTSYIEYFIPVEKINYCIRRFMRIINIYKDSRDAKFSMRYPGYWELMSLGTFRDQDLPIITEVQEEEKELKTYPKPDIPERMLIALAILNSKNGRLLASEIFAFIERHFPYYKTADKKWKKQTANEALKAIRGMFGHNKITEPMKEGKMSNGMLNVYYIRQDRLHMFQEFFENYQKTHPDPNVYGLENPELWPAMVKGELKVDEEMIRRKVLIMGKARSQMEKTEKDPYEKTLEQVEGRHIVRPALNLRLYACLAHLHIGQEYIFPRQFHGWLCDNIYYFKYSNPSWKIILKGILHKYFNKRPADNAETLKGNEELMVFGLDEKGKKKMIWDLVKFEADHPEYSIENYGVASQEKWSRLFPIEFRKIVNEETRHRAIDDDMEEIMTDDDDDVKNEEHEPVKLSVVKEPSKKTLKVKMKRRESRQVDENTSPIISKVKEEEEEEMVSRHGTRRKRIDFAKLADMKTSRKRAQKVTSLSIKNEETNDRSENSEHVLKKKRSLKSETKEITVEIKEKEVN